MRASALAFEQFIDQHVLAFIKRVQSWVRHGIHGNHGDFSLLGVASPDFYRYRSHERALAAIIRETLVNPILADFFRLHGYKAKQVEPEFKLFNASNERFENAAGVELVAVVNGERLGIRYTDFCPHDRTLTEVSNRYRLNKVLIVDWSDSPRARNAVRGSALDLEPFEVELTSIREMFCRFFSEMEFKAFLSAARGAVEKANDIIGMQAVTRLSLSRTASFKAEILDEIKTKRGTIGAYRPTPGEAASEPFGTLSDGDISVLDRVYYDEGLYYALVGSSGFAQCFVTAEYLRKVFSRGGSFDYTSIVCGYLKSIEQLASSLMRCRLLFPRHKGLFIKKKLRKMPVVGSVQGHRPYRMGKSDYVAFEPENEDCFDTSLGSLANFLHDDIEAWGLSKSGRHYVLWVLRQYAKDCRNGHFHKDNINDLIEVERIRDNTLFAAYLLLGGYQGGDAETSLRERLGIDSGAIEYDRLFNLMENMPIGCRQFKFEFSNDAIVYAARPLERPLVEYNDSGNIITPLLFTRLDGRSAAVPSLISPEDCDLSISKENMPEHVWFIRTDGRDISVM